jgi:hypothetical protein
MSTIIYQAIIEMALEENLFKGLYPGNFCFSGAIKT